MVVLIMEIVETHASEVKIRAVSVAPRLKHCSTSTGQSYLDEQRLIMMEIEALNEAQCSLCRDSALVSGKARLATEV